MIVIVVMVVMLATKDCQESTSGTGNTLLVARLHLHNNKRRVAVTSIIRELGKGVPRAKNTPFGSYHY